MTPAVFASAGLGLAAGSWLLLAVKVLGSGRKVRVKTRTARPERDKRETAAVLTGMAGMLLLAWGSRPLVLMIASTVGGALGLAAVRMLKKLREGHERASAVRELTVLFEAVELYLRAGYNLPQALRAASLLTPRLRPAVTRCLTCWPQGASYALEVLRRELGMLEAEILVSLLSQVEKVGLKDLEGVIQREAHNLERLRQLAEEVNIAKRPLYFTMYRALPLAAAVGIIVGPLLYRVVGVLRETLLVQ